MKEQQTTGPDNRVKITENPVINSEGQKIEGTNKVQVKDEKKKKNLNGN